MPILNDPRRLARLLASLNVQGISRPLSPVEVANEINVMRDELGGDAEEATRRLPVSAHIVNEFLRLKDLPAKIQDAVVWGESKSDDGSIGFSAAAKMAKLENGDDVLKLAAAMMSMARPVTKEEIKGVVSLKRRIPGKPIEECIAEVLDVTRSITIHHFLFVSGIKPHIARALVVNGVINKEPVAEALRRIFPTDAIKDVKLLNGSVRLTLGEEGWKFIAVYAERHGLLRQEVVSHMLEAEGFVDG